MLLGIKVLNYLEEEYYIFRGRILYIFNGKISATNKNKNHSKVKK